MERIGTTEWTIVLIGMGTVFVALIGLSLILRLFPLIFRKRTTPATTSIDTVQASPAAGAEDAAVSPELVAVITAAIAAASGQSASEVRITRVAPSGAGHPGLNTPVWGYADRLSSNSR